MTGAIVGKKEIASAQTPAAPTLQPPNNYADPNRGCAGRADRMRATSITRRPSSPLTAS